MKFRFLYFGDVVGRPGREFLLSCLPKIKEHYLPDFIFLNGENAAGGFGLTKAIAHEFLNAGIDAISMGNHTWDQKNFWAEIDSTPFVCRPANLPSLCPGKPYCIVEKDQVKVALLNILGRSFISLPLDCPFVTAEKWIRFLKDEGVEAVIVDVHAEASAEKCALGYYLMEHGATAVLGTHTHIQTSDERIIGGKTAYITDLGMCGVRESVLGFSIEPVIKKSITSLPCRFEVASGDVWLHGVCVDVDHGEAIHIERIMWK